LVVFASAGFFLLVFGALSRRCERQADVYAARTMERIKSAANDPAEALLNPRQLATVGAGAAAVSTRIEPPTFVGAYGAKVFASALRRVAAINNIPIAPRPAENSDPAAPRTRASQVTAFVDGLVDMANHWFHGSIIGRMDYLERLSTDPTLTARFDRGMLAVYAALLLVLFTSVALTIAVGLT
jgi:hypothetical protein